VTSAGSGPAVEVVEVSAGYGGLAAIDRVTCRVERGEFVGFVGPSGSGKTTLLRTLTGGVQLYAGRVEVLGRDVRYGHPPPGIGFVPQIGVRDLNFPLSVEQVVLQGFSPPLVGRFWFDRAERSATAALLERLGLAGLGQRRIGELSGGQLQRALLARAMVARRSLILLDEPTSGVDLASRREILRLLGELNEEGLTVVLTTHDLNWVAAQLPRIVCLNGSLIADGSPASVLTADVLRETYSTEVDIVHHEGHLLIADAEPILPAGGARRAST
jgi:ABC-type Mn2+/Zn2+ transport system ATPase subunit